jgi:hypothetical protein
MVEQQASAMDRLRYESDFVLFAGNAAGMEAVRHG